MSVVGTDAVASNGIGQVQITPVRLIDGARSFLRLLQRFGGATLVLAALGLWAVPGSAWAAELVLFKLTMSLAMGFSGLALWQLGSNSHRLEIEIDTNSYEVRVLLQVMGRTVPVLNCRFGDLQRIEVEGDLLRLWDAKGRFLAEVDMCQPMVRKRLLAALRDKGLLQAA